MARDLGLLRDQSLPAPSDALRAQLVDAHDKLCDFVDTGHYCTDGDCTREDPKCDHMHAIVGIVKLREALMPRHVGAHASRVRSGDAERVYAEEWARENAPESGRNGGHMTLELLPDETPDVSSSPLFSRVPPMISQRDAFVAATVIQWLGTNVGGSFVRMCEARIEKERAIRSELAPWDVKNRTVTPEDETLAHVACSQAIGTPFHDALIKTVASALALVRTKTEAVK
jgi:hypothetical protein